jgi:hypothetical protein
MNTSTKFMVGAVLFVLSLTTSALAAVTHTGKAVAKITVVTETSAQTTTSTSFVNLPGASANITVPAGKFQLVNVRFSAESFCFGASLAGNWCSVRILADGAEMLPNSGFDFAFDASGDTDDFWEGNAMERTLVLGGGPHTITAQWGVTNAGVTFRLDDWTLAITQHNGGN